MRSQKLETSAWPPDSENNAIHPERYRSSKEAEKLLRQIVGMDTDE